MSKPKFEFLANSALPGDESGVAMVGGGVIFIALDQMLSSHGGYLRKGAYVIAQHAKNKSKRQ